MRFTLRKLARNFNPAIIYIGIGLILLYATNNPFNRGKPGCAGYIWLLNNGPNRQVGQRILARPLNYRERRCILFWTGHPMKSSRAFNLKTR